jgi:hypothetical protein
VPHELNGEFPRRIGREGKPALGTIPGGEMDRHDAIGGVRARPRLEWSIDGGIGVWIAHDRGPGGGVSLGQALSGAVMGNLLRRVLEAG